MAPKTFYFVG